MKFILSWAMPFLVLFSSLQAANLRFLAWDQETAARKVAVVAGGDLKPVADLHPLSRSPAIKHTVGEDGVLRIRALDRASEDGKPLDFSVKLSASLQQPLILLLPDAQSPSGLRGFALDDNTSSFDWGSYRVINATAKQLGIILEQQRKLLPPATSGWVAVDLKPAVGKNAQVQLADPTAPEKPLYTSVWSVDPNFRYLVFVIPGTDPRLGPLAMKVIPEDRRAIVAAE